jgi:prepilin-type N-terminal cleavage/methylation domain-containing protein
MTNQSSQKTPLKLLKRRRGTRLDGRTAFTLIELLVAISVIGVLLAVSIPAVQRVRESARKTECLDRLHQLAVALRNHDASFDRFPTDGENGWGLATFLLPELEQRPLFEQLKPLATARADLATSLRSLLQTDIPVLECPSHPQQGEPTATGEGRTFYLGTSELFTRPMTFSDIIDGDSQTIAFGETRQEQSWSRPGLGTCGGGPNQGSFGSHHPGGVQIVLCDGQARFVGENVDSAVFAALCTPQGRDLVGDF